MAVTPLEFHDYSLLLTGFTLNVVYGGQLVGSVFPISIF